jgi:hypothetical protein
MSEDTVLQEVRSAREAFAELHGFNVRAMGAALRALDDVGDWPVVRLAPRRPAVDVAPLLEKDSEEAERKRCQEPV